jgi:carboxyl-terminal processing protease
MLSARFQKLTASIAAVVALISFLAVAPISRAEVPAVATHTEANAGEKVDLAKLFDNVVDTINQKFVNEKSLKEVDWQVRAKAVRPSVLAAASTAEAVDRINQLLAELKTSHTDLATPDDYRYYFTLDALLGTPETKDLIAEKFWGVSGPYYPGIGVFATKLEGRHFIDAVLEGSPADAAGLKFGDEILSVDGLPFTPIAAFRGKMGTTVDIEIRRTRTAEPQTYRVPVIPIMPSAAFSAATRASARTVERNGRRIGYIHLWQVRDPRSFGAALASIDPFFPTGKAKQGDRPLDALIVDMRGRVGGTIGAASQMLDMLGTAEKPYWGQRRSLDRTGRDAGSSGDQRIPRSSDPLQPFRGQTVLLIDDRTRSAGEIMAHGFKRSRFGPLIGTTTAGAVTSGTLFTMPGGLVLYTGVVSHEFDGKPLEGVGVAPDIRVERPLPYAAGADPVLDAAVTHLTKGGVPHWMNGYGVSR